MAHLPQTPAELPMPHATHLLITCCLLRCRPLVPSSVIRRVVYHGSNQAGSAEEYWWPCSKTYCSCQGCSKTAQVCVNSAGKHGNKEKVSPWRVGSKRHKEVPKVNRAPNKEVAVSTSHKRDSSGMYTCAVEVVLFVLCAVCWKYSDDM